MSYNTLITKDDQATAAYVEEFAHRQEERWRNQQAEDTRSFEITYKQRAVEVRKSPNNQGPPIRALRSGFGGIAKDRNLAVLSRPPTIKFNPPDNSDKMSRHASLLLEPWVAGAWKQSQVENVWGQQMNDLVVYGRGYSCLWYVPSTWAGDVYGDMADERASLVSEGGHDGRVRDLLETMDEYRKSHFPFRWHFADAANVWPQFSVERYLPEVIEKRQMTIEDIKANYGGSDAIPEGYGKSSSSTLLDVYIYTNHYVTATVIPGGATSGWGPWRKSAGGKVVHSWRHDYGLQPYLLLEANILNANSLGLRWKSMLFDYQDMIESFDEFASDLRQNFRRNALAPVIIHVDPRAREDAELPLNINYGPGVDHHLMLPNESIDLAASPAFSPEHINYGNMLRSYIETIALNPAERGMASSGTSAVGFAVQLQAAQITKNPYDDAVVATAERWVKTAFRGVEKLGEKVFVSTVKRGRLGVGPADVKGWSDLAQARVSHTLPINKQQQMTLYSMALQNHIPPIWAMEQYLDIENAEAVYDLWERSQIRLALLEENKRKAVALMGQLAQVVPAQDLASFAEQITNLPPWALQPLEQRGVLGMQGPGGAGPGTQPGSQGAQMQGASNTARGAGLGGQGMSETVALQMPPGG